MKIMKTVIMSLQSTKVNELAIDEAKVGTN